MAKTNLKIFKATSQEELEQQMNAFLNEMDSWFIEDINVSMSYNFLPQTNLGEKLEIWIGSVAYSNEEE